MEAPSCTDLLKMLIKKSLSIALLFLTTMEMGKLKHREIESFAKSHTASNWQRQDSHPSFLDPKLAGRNHYGNLPF